jgi:NAD(P)-dependent dehydrogenase (short-subunit alcohol dehydrogenase family)
MTRLEGKRAIVTGGGSGMGAALVTLLCKDGASVLAADVNEAGLEAVAAATGCTTRRTDITSETENVAMVEAAVARFGGLDLVFLNAGILGRPIPDQMEPLTDVASVGHGYRAVMSVNLDGVVFGTLAAATAMQGSGSIVVTASAAGLVPWPPDPAYTVSKHGAVGWVRSIAPALEQHGIAINAICPGAVDTPLIDVPGYADDLPRLEPSQAAEAMVATALDGETGRAVSVVAGRDPICATHEFNELLGFS